MTGDAYRLRNAAIAIMIVLAGVIYFFRKEKVNQVRITAGMTEAEVSKALGEPDGISYSPIPSESWFYVTNQKLKVGSKFPFMHFEPQHAVIKFGTNGVIAESIVGKR